MAEKSFPVVEQPMGVAEWQRLALTWGYGIIDQGGLPYYLTNKDSVNNTVTISPSKDDPNTAEAILSGFVHFMDAPKILTVPAVATSTTYEIGLVHDPLNPAQPVVLDVWTTPADMSGGKKRLVLYRGTRPANTPLSDVNFEEIRPRASFTFNVYDVAHMPPADQFLVGSICYVIRSGRSFQSYYEGGSRAWVELTDEVDLSGYFKTADATALPTPGKIAVRDSGGRIQVGDPGTNSKDAVNKGHLDNRIANHNHSASGITSGILNRARIDGSTHAWNHTIGGTYSTLAVDSSGRFGKWSSTERHKTNAQPWRPDPRRLLEPDAWIYDRLDPQTREVTNTGEVGTIAERNLESVPEFVQWGPDTLDEDGNPETETLVQGWNYHQWTAAHQRLHRWHAARLDAVTAAVERIAEKAGVDVSDLLEGLEWPEGGDK